MYVNRELLKEMTYNVLLWTPGKGDAKKSVSGGRVEVSVSQGLSFLSTDGYVAVQTGSEGYRGTSSTSGSVGSAIRGEVTGEDLRVVLKAISELDEEDIEVSIDGTTSTLYFGKTGVSHHEHDPRDLWDTIRGLVDPLKHSSADIKEHFSGFYLDTKRLSKFSLLEPKLEYPLALAPSTSDVTGQPTILWKYGRDVRGVLAPLTPELVAEEYQEIIKDVMW